MWKVAKIYQSEDERENKIISAVYEKKEDASKDYQTTCALMRHVCGEPESFGYDEEVFHFACYVTIKLIEV